MPEIRFTVTEKLNDVILEVCGNLGADKADYVRSLILGDLLSRESGKRGKNARD